MQSNFSAGRRGAINVDSTSPGTSPSSSTPLDNLSIHHLMLEINHAISVDQREIASTPHAEIPRHSELVHIWPDGLLSSGRIQRLSRGIGSGPRYVISRGLSNGIAVTSMTYGGFVPSSQAYSLHAIGASP